MLEVSDAEMPAVFGFSVVLILAATLKLFSDFLSFFQEYKVKLPNTEVKDFIQDSIELATKQCNLVLHLKNVEAESHTLSEWLDIAQAVDFVSLNKHESGSQLVQHGRVLLAVSMKPDNSKLCAIRESNIQIEHISLSSYSEESLKAVLSERFINNNFNDEFIKLLIWQGKIEDKILSVLPSQLVTPMAKLFDKCILQRVDKGWVINEPEDVELNSTLGRPLRIFFAERHASIDKSLIIKVNEFMQLASLCGSWIPQHPLLDAIGVVDRDKQDEILDAIENAFVECEPPLLQDYSYNYPGFDKIAVYRPLYSVLSLQYAMSFGKVEKENKAKMLLDELSGKYPLNNYTFASLYWNIATFADSNTQKEWRENLQYYVNILTVRPFTKWLNTRIYSGWIEPIQMMDNAVERGVSPIAMIYLNTVMNVCEKYYSSNGGYPLTKEFSTSLSNIGYMYGELGNYNKALEYKLQALNIFKAILPEQHIDLAISLNNVGLSYGDLEDNNKALEYQIQALKIREAVLPKHDSDLAASFNNVGLTYGKLGNYEKALKFLKKAIVVLMLHTPNNTLI